MTIFRRTKSEFTLTSPWPSVPTGAGIQLWGWFYLVLILMFRFITPRDIQVFHNLYRIKISSNETRKVGFDYSIIQKIFYVLDYRTYQQFKNWKNHLQWISNLSFELEIINKIFFATMYFLITIVHVGRLVRKLMLHNHEIPIVIICMERARMMSWLANLFYIHYISYVMLKLIHICVRLTVFGANHVMKYWLHEH